MELNLHQFVGYDPTTFKEYLLANMPKGKQWQFTLPKTIWSPQHANNQVVHQYLIAAYFGEALRSYCFTIGYNVPTPYKEGQFVFSVKIKGRTMPQLAKLLSLIANSYTAEQSTPEWIYFVEKATEYFQSPELWEKKAPVCAGLWMVCEQFYEHPDDQ